MGEIPDDIAELATYIACIEHAHHTVGHAILAGAIERAILAERERCGWLPIETAPRDGTAILVYQNPSVFVVTYDRVGWHDGCNGYNFVTHWQPLPKPPVPTSHQHTQGEAS